MPSLADRSGNLSDLAGTLTRAVNGQYLADDLSHRLGYAVQVGEPYYTQGCSNSTQCVLPNATIPQSAWSTPAVNLLRDMPLSTQGTNQFSTAVGEETLLDNKGAIRLDDTTHYGMLSAYYFIDEFSLYNP